MYLSANVHCQRQIPKTLNVRWIFSHTLNHNNSAHYSAVLPSLSLFIHLSETISHISSLFSFFLFPSSFFTVVFRVFYSSSLFVCVFLSSVLGVSVCLSPLFFLLVAVHLYLANTECANHQNSIAYHLTNKRRVKLCSIRRVRVKEDFTCLENDENSKNVFPSVCF